MHLLFIAVQQLDDTGMKLAKLPTEVNAVT